MLQDGLELTPGSLVLNSLIENGPALPTVSLRTGRVFFLTVDQGDTKAGAYVYSAEGWKPMGSGPSAPEVVKYDIGLFCGGKVDIPDAVLASFLAPRVVYLETNLPDSVARCKTPPLAQTTYLISVNDVASGTVTFSPGSSVGVIAFPYSMLVEAGHTIEILLPTAVDTAISDVGVTIVANVNVAPGVIGV